MKLFNLFLFSVLVLAMRAQPTYSWVSAIGGASSDYAFSMTTDAPGNVYITGGFYGTMDFDPGPGTQTLTASGRDAFFAKYNSSGNYIWAKQLQGTNTSDFSYNILLDASGNVYICGFYTATNTVIDFDPGPGTQTLAATSGSQSMFMAKYDNNGNYVWAKNMNAGSFLRPQGMHLDAAGNIYLCGTFGDNTTVDFDPGPGVQNLTTSDYDLFYAKYDNNGNYIWAKSIGGTGINDLGNAIRTDVAGNIYMTGYFSATVDFDPGPGTQTLTSIGNRQPFLAKYDGNGNYIWANGLMLAPGDNGTGVDLELTANGDVIIAGWIMGTVDFDPGPGTQTLAPYGGPDVYIARYTANGNYVWAKLLGGTGFDEIIHIKLDANDNIYAAGSFEATLDFDPGPGTSTVTSNGLSDAFFAKYDNNGNYIWSTAFGGSGDDKGYSIKSDAAANVHVVGSYSLTVDFDPGPGTQAATSNGALDIFLGKYSCALPALGAVSGVNQLCANAGANIYSVAAVPGATAYSWGLPVGWTGTSTTNTINATPGSSGQFSISASNLCGISPAQTLSVTVNALPVITASTSNTQLCIGESATLTAGGGNTYTWNPGGAGTSIIISPTVNTTYTVTGTDANTCQNFTMFTQNVINCSSTSIAKSEASALEILISPNPFHSEFSLSGEYRGKAVEIYNATGQKVISLTTLEKEIFVDMTNYESGIYFIKIGAAVKKLIKY